MSLSLSLSPSLCLSVSVCQSLNLSVSVSVCLSVSVSVCLSVCLSLFISVLLCQLYTLDEDVYVERGCTGPVPCRELSFVGEYIFLRLFRH